MSPDISLDEIAQSLGVPKRIFVGQPDSHAAAMLQYYDARDKRTQEGFRAASEKIITERVKKIVDENFPEANWELMFCLSPRGRVMRRREKPITIAWK